MQKAHDASYNNHWKDKPDLSSPILAAQLNRIEQSTDTIDDRVVLFDSTKANQTDLLQTLKTLTYNTETGVFVFTYWNGSTYTVDLNIEKIPVSFSLSPEGILTMTTADGTTYTVDISTLIKLYTFADSTDIDFTTTTDSSGNKTITAHIVNGSVTEEKLEPNFLANCRIEVSKAETAADNSEAWATGKIDGTDVPSTAPQYHNNSKYYSEQASGSAEDSEAWAVGQRNGTDVPSTDETYHNNAKYYAEQASQGAGVLTFNGRHGDVVPTDGDYSIGQISPSTGATEGQIPIVNSNGEFEMQDIPSSGHTIENTSGTSMTQREGLQFVGVFVGDDSIADRTKVNIARSMTRAQMDALTSAQKKGFIRTTDEPDNPYVDKTLSGTVIAFGDVTSYTPPADGYITISDSDTDSSAFLLIYDTATGMALGVGSGFNPALANTACARVYKDRSVSFAHRAGTISGKFMAII